MMPKFDKVSSERKAKIFAYNRKLAADSSAAADMHKIAEAIARLPKGLLKKVLSDKVVDILAKYGVEV
jgi:hypothetical protein